MVSQRIVRTVVWAGGIVVCLALTAPADIVTYRSTVQGWVTVESTPKYVSGVTYESIDTSSGNYTLTGNLKMGLDPNSLLPLPPEDWRWPFRDWLKLTSYTGEWPLFQQGGGRGNFGASYGSGGSLGTINDSFTVTGVDTYIRVEHIISGSISGSPLSAASSFGRTDTGFTWNPGGTMSGSAELWADGQGSIPVTYSGTFEGASDFPGTDPVTFAGSHTITSYSAATGNFSGSGNQYVVPEPAALLLVALCGMAGLRGRGRRRVYGR